MIFHTKKKEKEKEKEKGVFHVYKNTHSFQMIIPDFQTHLNFPNFQMSPPLLAKSLQKWSSTPSKILWHENKNMFFSNHTKFMQLFIICSKFHTWIYFWNHWQCVKTQKIYIQHQILGTTKISGPQNLIHCYLTTKCVHVNRSHTHHFGWMFFGIFFLN